MDRAQFAGGPNFSRAEQVAGFPNSPAVDEGSRLVVIIIVIIAGFIACPMPCPAIRRSCCSTHTCHPRSCDAHLTIPSPSSLLGNNQVPSREARNEHYCQLQRDNATNPTLVTEPTASSCEHPAPRPCCHTDRHSLFPAARTALA